MRWLTLPEVAEHMLEVPASTVRDWRLNGQLDAIVSKRVGRQERYHPEAAWYFACHGTPAPTLEDAYAWADTHPLPAIPTVGAQIVRESA